VTGESLTAGSDPLGEETLGHTETMDDLVHHADHVLLVQQNIGSGLDVVSGNSDSGEEGSLGTRGQRASVSGSNVITGSIGDDDQGEVSVDTRLEDRGSRHTAGTAGTGLEETRDRVLGLESSREVVEDRREELGNVGSAGRGHTVERVVAISSEVAVAGEGSAGVVVTLRVEVFFNVDELRFFELLVIVSALVGLHLLFVLGEGLDS